MYTIPEYDWRKLERMATEVVEESVRELPVALSSLAAKVSVIYRKWHPDALAGDLDALELLGEYLSFEEDRLSEQNGPIVLYLGAIQLFCEEEAASFEEETRVTYLHELGHHFGWDEDDLAERGLD